jgi:hypothetical protein
MPFYCFKNHCNIPCYFLNSSCSGKATRISPENSEYSWSALAVDGHNVLAVSSSPIDPPQIKYGHQVSLKDQTCTWVWDEVNNNPLMAANNKVKALLSHHQFSILKIPVTNPSDDLSDGIVMDTNILDYHMWLIIIHQANVFYILQAVSFHLKLSLCPARTVRTNQLF